MNNNKFIRDKTKFNPDVLTKLSQKDSERKTMKVDMQQTIYNPITNIIPPKITNQRDLMINVNSDSIDIKKRLHELSNERSMQDVQYKPVQTKLIQDEISNVSINTFNDLKSNTTKETNKNKYNSVLDNLKDLGIIN
jgi:hypothetical protein